MVENGVEIQNPNTIYPNSTIQIHSIEVGGELPTHAEAMSGLYAHIM